MRVRWLLPAVVVLTVPMAGAPLGPRSPAPAAAGRLRRPVVAGYAAPVTGQVVRPFDPPATPYGPGHRGVDLAASTAAPVRAAADGLVTFAGPVAGRGVVVLAHPDGLTTEYEPVRPLVARGARVRGGEVIAVIRGRHAGCAATCLHWGARRGPLYLDPLSLLRPLGPVVLLPWPRDG